MFEIKDLSIDFDHKVLCSFYYDFLLRYFPSSELESFEDVLMALQWSSEHDRCGKQSCSCRTTPRVGLAILQNCEQIIAGVVYDYYPTSNYGLIANVAVEKNARGKGLSRQLVEYAVKRLGEISSFHGYEKIEEIVTEVHKLGTLEQKQEIDVLTRHNIYQKLGFRQILYPYIAPPLKFGNPPSSNFHLLVYRPKIVCNYQIENGALPGRISAAGLVCFIKEYWNSVCEKEYIGRIGVNSETEFIVKASLPWIVPDDESTLNKVIVIGGGLSALSAASSLSQTGFNVVLLEAAAYLGGRVKQIEAFKGFTPIDVGAEFIHGSKTVVNVLAKQQNWQTEEMYNYGGVNEGEEDPRGIYFKGCIHKFDSDHTEIKRFLESWEEVQEYGEKLVWNKDKASDLSIEEFLKTRGYSQDVLDLFRVIHCQFEGASLKTHGVMELMREEMEYEYGYENFRLRDSLKVLVKYFIDKCFMVDKYINWQVVKVEKQGNDCSRGFIKVTSVDGKEQWGSHVVVTVPLKVLQDRSIIFTPPLPCDKLRAIDSVNMLGGLKITCQFKKKFWPESLQMLYAVECWISTLWMFTLGPNSDGEICYAVTGFETADLAEEKRSVPENELVQRFLVQLDTIFGNESDPKPASSSCLGHIYYHWSNDPHVRGAYSSGSVGAFGLRAELASSVDGYLFFAGEHTNAKTTATIHAAIETGERAANEVIQSIKHLR